MNKELEALERLYKCNDEDYTLGYQQHDYKLLQQAVQRLEAIDQLQEQLGCPLEVFVKLHEISHIYTNYGKVKILQILKDSIAVKENETKKFYYLSEYKKTWWLKETREE